MMSLAFARGGAPAGRVEVVEFSKGSLEGSVCPLDGGAADSFVAGAPKGGGRGADRMPGAPLDGALWSTVFPSTGVSANCRPIL